MKRHVHGSFAVGLFLVIALLASTAVPGYAQRGGGGSHGGGGAPGWHGGGGHAPGGGWHGGGGGWRGGGGGWRGGGGGWRGGWWGPGVFIGAGLAAPFWWYPYYGYPYPYAYPYPYGYPAYSPPVVEGSPQTYIEQEAPAQQYWYYCQNPQGYYPYVRECPGGWQQVAPQPPPPPR
jgi:hypothetical protein